MGHWIIAPVIVPALFGALVISLVRHDLLLQRVFSVLATGLLVLIAFALFVASSNGPETYFLGSWPAPFGIVLVLDRLSGVMVLLTAILAFFVVLYTIGTNWDHRGKYFHSLFQFQLMGVCGAFLTGDAFNLFVFFEVLLIASYGLMIYGGGKERLSAGVQYIAFNLLGSSLFLFALAMIYGITGTLNIADIAVKAQLISIDDSGFFRAAILMLLLVFAIKGGLFPLQFWLPATYANAPGPVVALFAIMSKVGAYAVIRFGAMVVPISTPAIGTLLSDLLLPAGVITLVLGSLGVIGTKNLRRLAAYTVITSMGAVFIAVSQFSEYSLTAALYYMVHSTLAGGAFFLIVDMIASRRDTIHLQAVDTKMAQQGLLAALFMVAAIALAGLPPLSGFIGKIFILDALSNHAALVWPSILGTSLIIIIGLARAGSVIFWQSPTATSNAFIKTDDTAKGQPLAFIAIFGLLTMLVILTLASGPATDWLFGAAIELTEPEAYISSNHLPEL